MDETAPPDSRDTRSDSVGGGLGGMWARILFLLVVVYPLSTGPVLKALELGGASPQTRMVVCRAVYAPLVVLSERLPPVNGFFDWYVGQVWRVR